MSSSGTILTIKNTDDVLVSEMALQFLEDMSLLLSNFYDGSQVFIRKSSSLTQQGPFRNWLPFYDERYNAYCPSFLRGGVASRTIYEHDYNVYLIEAISLSEALFPDTVQQFKRHQMKGFLTDRAESGK